MKPKTERRAEFLDTIGKAANYLFARHKETGHRITARVFYRKFKGGTYEREGYVLMTTKSPWMKDQSAEYASMDERL